VSIIAALHNEHDEEQFRKLLLTAKATENVAVITFAKENLFPKYLECGQGWEPAKLDENLCEFYREVNDVG